MGDAIGSVAIVGGLLLAAVLAWAVLANRRRSRGDRQRTEAATRELYREVDRQDQASDPDRRNY